MRKIAGVLLLFVVSAAVFGQSGDRAKDVERVQWAANVLEEIMSAPDKGIPEEIMSGAKCVAVVPSLKKAGLGFGGQYGRGVASCRTATGWSAPAFFMVGGGSFGLQIGAQAVDLVMIITSDKGMERLLSSKFKLGANASAAAGPVGRHVEGMTDWKMRAEVLTYSRARGLFGGLELNGAVIQQDKDSTRDFYGHLIPYKTLLTGATPAPADAQPFLSALAKYGKKD
jgi:lipid-binding SYLF domain-containing protein